MKTMKNNIVPTNTQPTTTIPAVAQQNNTTSSATQPIFAQSATTINPVMAGLGAVVSAIIIKEKPTLFIDTPLN